LDKFNYEVRNDVANTGFEWTISLSLGTPGKMMIIDTVVDDQFKMFQYDSLMINLIRCPVGFDLRGTNRTNGLL
jgi:hypothetical protein